MVHMCDTGIEYERNRIIFACCRSSSGLTPYYYRARPGAYARVFRLSMNSRGRKTLVPPMKTSLSSVSDT